MKKYTVNLLFTNLDNSLFTDWQAAMSYEIETDHYSHAHLLAERLQKLMEADNFTISEK